MRTVDRFKNDERKDARKESPSLLCELCGAECETDPESGELHCPVCENPEE
ncbi:MAG TPA: hypothetical protein VF775_02670 [Geobacteraceae bacterium]